MIDEIVGLIGRDADGNEAAFMTWGRVLHHDDPSIESLVLRYSQGCSLRSELASVELVASLRQISTAQYFYEGLSSCIVELSRAHLDSEWSGNARQRVLALKDIHFCRYLDSDDD